MKSGNLRKMMDRLNQNSHYGIMIDTEITKMIHDYIGSISCDYDRLNCPKPPIYIKPVKLMTLRDRIIEEAAKELQNKVDKLILQKEDNEMKATSVQNIKNVKDVCFSIDNHPAEMESKLTIVASTNDDIFAFEFEGPDLLQSCKRAGMFTGWEKDQKIIELEKDNKKLEEEYENKLDVLQRKYEHALREKDELDESLGHWKKEAADCLRLMDEAQKEEYKLKKENEKYEEKIKKLEHDDMLDKNAADYWSKEHDILLERFAKLQVENEKLKDKLENVEPFRSLERTIKEKQQLKEEYEEKLDVLQRKYDLEREANEAQHKFFREYAGNGTEIEFNYAIGDTDEVSYVIVDKEKYKALKDNGDRAMIHGEIYTTDQLINRILELEALKMPIIENFSDEQPSSRRDILRCAEKCVCGKREQDYGTPESNFQLIADLWNDYLKKERSSIVVDAKDVAMMMALMKIARIRNGGGSGDSFVDLAGYAACGGEIWASNKETNGDSSQETDTV